MGAQQSSNSTGGAGSQVPVQKTCYYELLQVDREATDDVIKKAYRKRALELHPDRNINNVEVATQQFAQVQAAYEVLSDPQERAWYDSHRDAILSGQDDLTDGAAPTHFRNVRLTSTEEIMSLIRKFNTTIPFDDEPTGFYGISRETFEHLALEEEAACEFENLMCPEYPTFGSSEDDFEPVVKVFYNAWAGFSTKKSFSWKDKYRVTDAPDRRVRRLMEKENKQLRDSAIREFNETVRFLVSFVRKRDPRYLPNRQSDADRQKALRDAAADQAARSRAANAQNIAAYQLPDWAKTEEPVGSDEGFEDSEGTSEEEPVELLECVVCNKTFKSDGQLAAHERSKKHTKAVQQLKRQMKREGAELELDVPAISPTDAETLEHLNPDDASLTDRTKSPSVVGEELNQSTLDSTPPITGSQIKLEEEEGEEQDGDDDDENDDDYAPRSIVEERLGGLMPTKNEQPARPQEPPGQDELANSMNDVLIHEGVEPRKVGKAKAKREKKAARQAQDVNDRHRCSICAEQFDSRTKLFDHIRKEGHAAIHTKPVNTSKKTR